MFLKWVLPCEIFPIFFSGRKKKTEGNRMIKNRKKLHNSRVSRHTQILSQFGDPQYKKIAFINN